MRLTTLHQPFNGENLGALELDGKSETGEQGLPVHEHGASAALAELATVLRSREPQVFPEDFEESLVRGNGDLFRLPVDPKPQNDVLTHIRYSTIGAETPAMVGYDKRMSRVLLLSAALACQSPEPSGGSELRELEIRMTELVNVEREARGVAPLVFSPTLADVGRGYSAKMAAARRVNHDLDRPVEERVLEVLPGTCTFGENLSKHTTVDYSIGDLLISPGHRANILGDRFTLIGVGIARGADGYLYITQVFARPCDSPPKGSKRRQDLSQ
jgi:uncharacterized protein YkwD